MSKHYIAPKEQIAAQSRLVVCCEGIEIGIFCVEDELYAWQNVCGHLGGPVCQGRVFQKVLEPLGTDMTTRMLDFCPQTMHIVCPWHGYEFDIRTGLHPAGHHRLRKIEVAVEDGDVYVVL